MSLGLPFLEQSVQTQPGQGRWLLPVSDTVFTLYSRLYNRLCELCKWAQPSGAWAVQPGRLWRHYAQQGGCVDSRRCGAFDRFFKELLFVHLFLPSAAHDPEGWQKLDRSQNSNKTVLYSIYLFIYLLYEYSKGFTRPVAQPVVQPAAQCKRTLKVLQ